MRCSAHLYNMIIKGVGLVCLLACFMHVAAQPIQGRCDSWQEVLSHKQGMVTAIYDEIEPFIYTNQDGTLAGVEYEIMESLKDWLTQTYKIELSINWEKAGSFQNIFPMVKNSRRHGVFGWAYYSITPERQKQVQFTLPYMPDVNVLVTNNREPMYASAQEFTGRIKEMQAYSQLGTTMREDIEQLKRNFYPRLQITTLSQDYEILKAIANDEKGFGYVPLSVYIVALQKGIRVKRQNVLSSRRQGFAAVMPLHSDWKPVMDEYFSSMSFRQKASQIITRYLGSEVKDLVFEGSQALPTNAATADLVSLEKEIVTRRLMDTVEDAARHRALLNILAVLFVSGVVIIVLMYNRSRTKQKLTAQLSVQKEQIEQMNQLLKMKILQARMNPHFLFNSLNSIQYFITGDDKKASLQYISRFSAFLRKVINLGDELYIQVSDEADLLREYLWLEHCRFHDKFDYEITVSPDARQALILPLITHSLVESALYNGVLNLGGHHKGKLFVRFFISGDALTVQITDNGISRENGHSDKRLLHRDDTMFQKRIDLFNAQSKRKIISHLKEEEENGQSATVSSLLVPQPLFEIN